MKLSTTSIRTMAVATVFAAALAGSTSAQAAMAPAAGSTTSTSTLDSNLAPRAGALWGAFPNAGGGYTSLESTVGRKLGVVHKYIPWTFNGWSQQIAPILNSGHIALVSWSAAKTTNAASIINGNQDGVIRAAATNLKALGGNVLLRPFYEFDQPVGHPRYIGTPAQVIAAWQHTYNIFKSVGATNVRFVWSPMAFDFKKGVAQKFWPGAAYVDWVGPDGYNFPGAQWHDWDTIFGAAYSFAVAQGKPMIIPETASPAKDSRTPAWITQGAAWIQSHPDVKSVNYFDSVSPKGYDFRVTSNAKTLAAYKAWGQMSYFSPAS